ncbi:MAG: hypothetical protein QMD00_02025 [Hadesarchaea archaeon]|nr:hypothetical protein [Hadesarchaea archaeon]
MSAIDILYLVLLVGSLAFGLEAMLLGLGGKLMVLYRRRKAKTLAIALAVGLSIVGPAVVTSVVFALEPLYFCVLLLAYMFIAGKLISVFEPGRVRTPPPPLPPRPSEKEIEAMVRNRGLGKLVSKKRKRC